MTRIEPHDKAVPGEYKRFIFPNDVPLLVCAAGLTLYYSAELRRRSIKRIIERFRRRRSANRWKWIRRSPDNERLDKAWRGTSFILTKVFRSDKPCLRRTLVLYHMFCQDVPEMRAVIGVAKEGKKLLSHAWIEVAGKPYREDVLELAKYTPILRW